MNHQCRVRASICASLLVLILGGRAALAQSASGDKALLKLADEYFDAFLFPSSPTLATQSGIHRYDDQIENYSRTEIDRQIAELNKFERRIAATDEAQLSEAVRGDRELLLGSIRSQLLTLETIRPWEKNPDSYSSGITGTAFATMSKKFAPGAERLRLLIAREKLMPAALSAARANLKNPPRIYTEIALEQLPGLVEFFKNDVPAAFTEVKDPSLNAEFKVTNAGVMQALTEYEAWLRSEVLPKSKGDFRIGADTFVKKLAYDEMVDTPLERLVAIDMADLKRNQMEFARIAKEISPDKTAAQVLADLAADHPEPAKLLASFRSTFDGLIKFINDKKIITIPSDVRPILQETPPFMRATTFASMDTPGPFEKVAKEAFFNVTLPDKGWDSKRTEEFMAQFNYPVISNVVVHEAYPGHYIQFLTMHTVQDRVRKLLGASTNSEGWAHYCEQMMLDEGFAERIAPNDPRRQNMLRLGQLQDALLRNARFIVGIKLHTGQMTFDEGVDFFVKEGYQTREVGVVETKRGTSDPTYLYYTLGKLEIMKLREDLKRKQGAAFSLQNFHDEFMRQGYPPIKIVRRALLKDDSPPL